MWRKPMNRHKISMFGAMLCLLGLGFSDTANGQITTTPALGTGMSFQVQSGGATSSQSLTITATAGATTLVVTVPNNQTWMTVGPYPPGTMFFPNASPSVTLPVTVNTTGLTTGQTYSANISIAINNQPSTLVQFPVVLAVGTPSLLSSNPVSLTFSAVQGASSGSPSSTPIIIQSSGPALNYNVSAQTQFGSGNWLLLSNTLAISTSNSIPGFSVSVNAQTLASGTYTGTITVQSTTTADSVTIPVTLSVTTGAALNVTGTLSNFVYQSGSGAGGFSAQTQTLMISTTSASLNYQVTATPGAGSPVQTTNWLVLSSTGGLASTVPQQLNLMLSYNTVASLPAGTYTITLAIGPTAGAGSATNVTVTLLVTNNALLSVNSRSLTYSIPFGSTSPQTQSVQVSSSNGSSIAYTVLSNQSWLSGSPGSGTTAANSVLNVTVNASNLNVSATPYVGTLTVYPNNSDYSLYSIPITVQLTVTAASAQIFAGPAELLFSYQTTLTSQSGLQQNVKLTSPSTLGFSVSTTTMNASNCPTSNWLSAAASQNVTPATLTVSVAPTGMTSGFCTGTVTVTYFNGVSNTTTLIPVVVDIAATPLLTVTPDSGFGVVAATYGSTSSLSSRISLNSTDGVSPLEFSAFASTPGAPVSWLYLASSSGTTQNYLQVNIQPSGLPVGVYNGSITIHATNSASLPSGDLTIPVVLTVAAATTVSVSPASLSFTQAQGATPPASQTVALTAAGGTTTFTATASTVIGNWLQITPLSGTASATTSTITASILQNTLSPGTYTGNITLTFQNSATPNATIPVTLLVTASQTVVVSSTTLGFNYQLGSAAPANQTLNVTSTGGAVAISVASTSTPGFLSVTPASGSTGAPSGPLVLTVSVTPAVFTTAGTYTGTITITPTGQTAITVQVTVTVTGVPIPQPTSISNSANGGFGAIAPGELITIKGTGIGPSTSATFTLAAGNTVSNLLSGVQVLFDGIPGTPTYVSATQINVVVPYEIAGRATTNVVVSYQQVQSSAILQNVASQAPGIYTFSATGAGQAAVLNQNYTFNGPAAGIVINGQNVSTTPAAQGSYIYVYMTGGGQTSPASVTGTITPTPTNTTPLYNIPTKVTATINGVNATVLFAGAAPGLVTGVIQVNLQVPTGVTGSALPLVVTINGSTTLSGPTVAVQ
jgi:uncharacterized protein (TIGR03437 family)